LEKKLKIGWLSLLLVCCFVSRAQTEQGLLPFSNRLLLNPSYAGLNRNTHVWTSLQLLSEPDKNLNHAYTLTYDTWSDRMESGLGFWFYQGLTGQVNTNTTGLGLAFTKPFDIGRDRQFIPSVSLNAHKATKQWFVKVIDDILDKEVEPPSPPGEEFFRYNLFRPRVGLLWSSAETEWGIAASYTFQQSLTETKNIRKQTPYHFIFHITRKMKGIKEGLVSQPFRASPELIFLYTDNLILSRAGFKMERTDYVTGIYLQNNYSQNIHGIGGAYGWNFGNFRIHFFAGAAYSIPNNKTAFFAEGSLGLRIPYVHFEEKKPWVPPRKSF